MLWLLPFMAVTVVVNLLCVWLVFEWNIRQVRKMYDEDIKLRRKDIDDAYDY